MSEALRNGITEMENGLAEISARLLGAVMQHVLNVGTPLDVCAVSELYRREDLQAQMVVTIPRGNLNKVILRLDLVEVDSGEPVARLIELTARAEVPSCLN